MRIRLTKIRNALWFWIFLTVALAFPLQVYSQSPYPSLIPYVLIILTLLGRRASASADRPANSNIDLMVTIYMFLVLVNTTWQCIFGVINVDEGINALAVYLLPVIFYWYFSRVASEKEIRSSLRAMFVAGLVVGLYFAYDSYVKLALKQVSDYSHAAYEYSVSRAGGVGGDVNDVRIGINGRSQGLLESHSVSGAWTVIGALAALTLLPRTRRAARMAVVLLFGTMILLGLNFTAIIAFAFIMVVLEFSGLTAARGRSSRFLSNLASLAIVVAIFAAVVTWAAGEQMSELIVEILTFQRALALGNGEVDLSYSDIVLEHVRSYYNHIATFPLSLLFGDGFSTYGIPKGGDIGLVETLSTFGLPYYLAVVFCLAKLIATAMRRIKDDVSAEGGALDHRSILKFSVGMTLLAFVTDIHYTVWPSKSVLPVLFFVIALYGRYLAVSIRSSTAESAGGRLIG